VSAQEPYEEDVAPRGLWSRVRERVFGVDEGYDEDGGAVAPPGHTGMSEAKRRASLRLETSRTIRVDVRTNATVFNDARQAADGLKSGQQQIVNLERATPQMAERIIDFLNGVTYALDGSVERIGEKVYLFAPANVQIEKDSGSEIG
jgi:cell division inhibitor SepF